MSTQHKSPPDARMACKIAFIKLNIYLLLHAFTHAQYAELQDDVILSFNVARKSYMQQECSKCQFVDSHILKDLHFYFVHCNGPLGIMKLGRIFFWTYFNSGHARYKPGQATSVNIQWQKFCETSHMMSIGSGALIKGFRKTRATKK